MMNIAPTAEKKSHWYTRTDAATEFKSAVLTGLSKTKKSLPSKFLYDQAGTYFFDKITEHPDYYLTGCELTILERYKNNLAARLATEEFNLIELGPGEGIKTDILINCFLKNRLNFSYLPVDISPDYLQKIQRDYQERIPALTVSAIQADYFSDVEWLTLGDEKKNVVLFLGSSIGNFNPQETQEFLQRLHLYLQPGDYLLIGFDLRKDPSKLIRAYNDTAGLTKAFNINLLTRINRDLGGHFQPGQFQHYGTYNVYSGAMESYIVSLCDQEIIIDALDKTFQFYQSEAIHTEYSYKYLLSQIAALAQQTQFEIVENFMDENGYFVDSLWQLK